MVIFEFIAAYIGAIGYLAFKQGSAPPCVFGVVRIAGFAGKITLTVFIELYLLRKQPVNILFKREFLL